MTQLLKGSFILLLLFLLSSCGTTNSSTGDNPKPEPDTPFTIGVFDTERGGIFNFADSDAQADLREDITASFPEATFSRTNVLATAFLESVDIVMLSSASSNIKTTSPLSATEQTTLKTFVEGGGGAVIFVDNDSFGGSDSDLVNESFLEPFDIDIVGTLRGNQTTTPLSTNNPIIDGEFGTVAATTYLFPGYFDALGTAAQSLATLDENSEASLAYIPRDALAVGSGGVTLFSDVNITSETLDENGSILIRNAIAYAAGF